MCLSLSDNLSVDLHTSKSVIYKPGSVEASTSHVQDSPIHLPKEARKEEERVP